MPAKKTTKSAKSAKKSAARKPAAQKTPSKKAVKASAGRKPAPKKSGPKSASHNGSRAGGLIYELKITLLYLNPPIWRRVQVASETPLNELHAILQMTMGWSNSHLHQFAIRKGRHVQFIKMNSMDDLFDELESESDLNENEVTLAGILPKVKAAMTYEYDFGDGWQHEIIVERIFSPDQDVQYPRCVGGENACPPDDVGGPPGYADFAIAVMNPRHPQHREMLDWAGGKFDPFKFDVEQVNKLLANPKNFVLYGPGL
jgi:hypothetical protein